MLLSQIDRRTMPITWQRIERCSREKWPGVLAEYQRRMKESDY
jgi:hypothetical protein